MFTINGLARAPVALWWAWRDLRLINNQALAAALSASARVVPVFVLDPALLGPGVSEKRLAFLFGGLAALDADLRVRGSRLILRYGDPVGELERLVVETGAGAIYAEEDPWPYARSRDAAVAERLPLILTGGITVHPPRAVHRSAAQRSAPYTVFTPYRRAWHGLPFPARVSLLAAPAHLDAPP